MKKKYILSFVFLLAFVSSFLTYKALNTREITNKSTLNEIITDIADHGDSNLRIAHGSSGHSYWILEDGYMVQAKDVYSATSYFQQTKTGFSKKDIASVFNLTSYAEKMFLKLGYKIDPQNSGSSANSGPFYEERRSYKSSDGLYQCVITLDTTQSIYWSVDCAKAEAINAAFQEQLPFLHALNDLREMAAVPYIEGNFASVNITNSVVGAGYAIMVRKDEDWVVLYQGQDNITCKLVEEYNIPKSIYTKCL